jgi:cell division protein FtsI/penicillin-binding protein 2
MNTMPKGRFYFFIFGLLAAAVCVLIRYGALVLDKAPDRADNGRPPPERGSIVDRNGKILASQVRRYDISITPPGEDDPDRHQKSTDLAYELAPILDMDAEEIGRRI